MSNVLHPFADKLLKEAELFGLLEEILYRGLPHLLGKKFKGCGGFFGGNCHAVSNTGFEG